MLKTKKVRYDLACGNNLQKGYIGVDLIGKPDSQADIVCNFMEFPWPIESNSVDEIFCSHYLEHIPHGDGYNDPLFKFMDEVWRILKMGGTAQFLCPYYTSVRAVQDPTHLRFISEPTFNYFNRKWREEINQLKHYPVSCNFEIIKIDHSVSEEFKGRSQEAMQFHAMHMWNVIHDLMVTMRKIK